MKSIATEIHGTLGEAQKDNLTSIQRPYHTGVIGQIYQRFHHAEKEDKLYTRSFSRY